MQELKAFLGIKFVMAINKLATIAEYWRVDNLIGNSGIQNIERTIKQTRLSRWDQR